MMPDREKIIKDWESILSRDPLDVPWDLIDETLALLKEQEAVVRCKDCKYAYLTDDGECKYCEMEKDDNGSLIERYRSWDWFCADGEPKEAGEVK